MSMTNILAYFVADSVTKKKRFLNDCTRRDTSNSKQIFPDKYVSYNPKVRF